MAITKIKADGLTADLIDETKLADDSIDSEHYNDGSIDTAHLADDAVTVDKIQNFGQNQIAGRIASGSGSLQGLSASDVRTMINVADGATNSPTTTINNNADNRVITGSGTANTLEGEANLTFDGSDLAVGAGNFNVSKAAQPTVLVQNSTDTSFSTVKLQQSSGSGGYFAVNKLGTNSSATGGANAAQIWQSGNAPIIFGVNNAERMRMLAGGGLTFNGDTAEANALDDYEYGTFDPTFRENNNASNTTYAWRYGEYTKIGRLVHCRIAIGLSAFSGNFNNAFLGIPFTAYSSNGNSTFEYVPIMGYSYASGFGDSGSSENLFLEIYGHNVASFRIIKGNSKSNVSQNDISSGQRIAISFSYTAAG
mgnify:CR=1 FL=1